MQEEYLYPVLQKIAPCHEDEKFFIENTPPLKIGFLPRKMSLYSAVNGTFETARGISLSYALNTYPLPVMGAVLVLATLIILGVSAFLRNRAQIRQNKILSDKNMELATTLRALENLKMERDIYHVKENGRNGYCLHPPNVIH